MSTRNLDRLAALRERGGEMTDLLGSLVEQESPSSDPAAVRACAAVVAQACNRVLGVEPELVDVSGTTHVLLRGDRSPRVLLLGHVDTVWPLGTLRRLPFRTDGGRATGPGVFDMKAGVVQALYAMSTLDDLDGVALLMTGDEEVGSPASRALVEECARGADAVLVLEPSQDGAVKVARKGVGQYRVVVRGRAAHAGLEPEKGVNALVGLAQVIDVLADLGDPAAGTTVTPTVALAGTAANVVPAEASVEVDVRTATHDEESRVDRAMRALRCGLDGATVHVSGGPNRPPLPAGASAGLHRQAQRLAAEMGLGELPGVAVGGGSDGNFTAGIGTPTLDGLGAVGAGAHADHEHAVLAAMPERAALVAALVEAVLSRRPAAPTP